MFIQHVILMSILVTNISCSITNNTENIFGFNETLEKEQFFQIFYNIYELRLESNESTTNSNNSSNNNRNSRTVSVDLYEAYLK